MNKQAMLGQRRYFGMVHGVTLRAVGTFSDDELDYRPRPEMRSVRELVHHIYTMEKEIAEGVRRGKVIEEGAPEALASLTTVAALQDYVRACHRAADEALEAMTDEDLARTVEAPYGSFPGWQFFAFAYDEHWHHRGQLYTYLRLLGKEPPMLYDYENSPA